MINQSSTVRTYPYLEQAPLQSTSLPLPQLSTPSVGYGSTTPLVDPFDNIQLSNIASQPQTGNPSTAFLDNSILGGQGIGAASLPGSQLKVGQQDPQAGALDMLKANWSDLGTMGKLGVGMSAATGLFNMYNGFQQARQMKSYMKNQMNLANKQYANNVKTYNTNMEDRQMRRNAANADTESVDSYMSRNRVG